VRTACEWLRDETPADAVLIEPVGLELLLNRAEREMLVSRPNFIAECGYPREAMTRRLELVEQLYVTGGLSDSQLGLRIRARISGATLGLPTLPRLLLHLQ